MPSVPEELAGYYLLRRAGKGVAVIEFFEWSIYRFHCLAHHIRYDDTDTLVDIVETLTAIIDAASRPDSDGDQEKTAFEHNDNQFREEPADVFRARCCKWSRHNSDMWRRRNVLGFSY